MDGRLGLAESASMRQKSMFPCIEGLRLKGAKSYWLFSLAAASSIRGSACLKRFARVCCDTWKKTWQLEALQMRR